MREDFDLLKKYTYLDTACMSLKPTSVVEAINRYYSELSSCAGRSSHSLGNKVQDEMDKTRKLLANFAGYKQEETIFLRNATEGINLVSKGLNFGGNILLSDKEHNSNLLPWQRTGKKIFTFSTEGSDEEIIESFKEQISLNNIGLTSFVHVSNLDGQVLPAEKLIKIAKKSGMITMLDACQSAPHKKMINSADFAVISGHKMFGPTGTGALFANKKFLDKLEPLNVGGGTVFDSTITNASWEKSPKKFEAGLQDYAGIIGFGAAIKYLGKAKNGYELLNKKLTDTLQDWKFEILGPELKRRPSICSFNVPKLDSHEAALMLDTEKILVRSGAHCCHSWFNQHKKEGSVRASFYYYNNEEDVDKLINSLDKLRKF